MPSYSGTGWLIVRAGSRACAIALDAVIETMRPLPVVPMPGTPPSVLGSAVIRGAAVPVVHAATLFGEAHVRPARFVTLRVAGRCVALAVDDVIGFRNADAMKQAAMPPLLSQASEHAVAALTVSDDELVLVLEGMRLVPPDVWTALERQDARNLRANLS